MSATVEFRCFVNVNLLIKWAVQSRMPKDTLYFIDWLDYDGVENKSFTIRFIVPFIGMQNEVDS
jgi:hypothetical protein